MQLKKQKMKKMNKTSYKAPVLMILILSTFLLSCTGSKKEKNALLDTKAFKEMNVEEKKEVLSKIIKGDVEPYRTEHLNVVMKLSNNPSKPVLWDGEIKNAEFGLIKMKTTVQGKKWDDFKSAGEYGLIYLGKSAFRIVTESVLDSLDIAFRPEYKSKYQDCEPQECLLKLKERLKNSGSIKYAKYANGKATIEYCKNYEEYKALQPQSNVSKEQWEDYFESGSGLEKALVDVPVRIMKELDFVERVSLKIPHKGRTHSLNISKKELEKYTNSDIKMIRKGWNEYFVDKYVYNESNRKKFLKKFRR